MFKILLLLFYTSLMAHSTQDLINIYQQKDKNYKPRTRHLEDGKAKFTNHLILANSPYLLQHAHNPVNWYGFSKEAFELAKSQNKLIFLSIGYATCHWCHVMEEESFEDLEVAKTLNDNFISIKVDREVLPDVDAHFMNIAQLTTGSGGWPLNVVLTPEGYGFFAGTYFPKTSLITNLDNVQNIWKNDKQRVIKTVKSIKDALKQDKNISTKIELNLQELAVSELLLGFDEFYGGFGNAPKFPHEAQILMLIDAQIRNPTDNNLKVITTTLDNMASGGFYDTVAGGFHRYATDNAWLFPHFEKMLYNQAQLALVYIKAYKLTKKDFYKRVAKQTLDYVVREMKDKNGGFYSATDADSEGKEGLFFIWDLVELKQILGADFKIFEYYFETSSSVEFEEKIVVHHKDINTLTTRDFIKIDVLLKKLYIARQARIKPILDNKILLSWNALLLKAFVLASDIDDNYLKEAQDLAEILMNNFYKTDLKRVKIDDKVSQDAIFEDYAYFADSLLALYDVTQNIKYLLNAQALMAQAKNKFWDSEQFGFKISNNKRINIDTKEIYDGAIFSSNGIAYGALNQLFLRTMDKKYQQTADQLLLFFSAKVVKNPSYYPTIVNNFTNDKLGEISQSIYLYDGKIKIRKFNNKLNISIAKGWHINAHQVLQEGIVATEITGKINHIIYPQAVLLNLGWSDNKLKVYQGNIIIKFNQIDDAKILIKLQACSDKVCLPPVERILI